ncbi:hypothetical protein J2X32_000835 [Rheinheimera pacifica]|uniref:four-helix bundle copper-binding protein n=1 Tax=Rheinheimera pacifica TaxID=173990 RepID=UPI0028624471|nr:four-helix bundle copper-binding protein [Rheinheimera pacifica]MDR6982227.1 hypothetical protein [Rheinheimera pacifica]
MSHEIYHACIDACNSCADACDHCSTACLQEDNVAHMERCIRLDIDCAALCRFAAAAMARSSEHVSDICRLCALLCEACAAECSKHDHDHCMECADACRSCAQACQAMVA